MNILLKKLLRPLKVILFFIIKKIKIFYYSVRWSHHLKNNKIAFTEVLFKVKLNIQGTNNDINIQSQLNDSHIQINGDNNSILFDKQSSLRGITISCNGNDNVVKISSQNRIESAHFLVNGNYHAFTLGEKCTVGAGDFWLWGNNCVIEIQSKTSIEKAHMAATEEGRKIFIGKDCMLSTDIEIRTGDSHQILDSGTLTAINPGKNVILEDHVWIGSRVSILKGVTIGQNSIVGTGSVVTKSISPGCVGAGNPAKTIKANITWIR